MPRQKSGRAESRANGKASYKIPYTPLDQGGPLPGERIRLLREAVRLKKRLFRLQSYGLPTEEPTVLLGKAVALIEEVCGQLQKVPKTWRPRPGSVGATPLTEGLTVTLRPAFAQKYQGIVEEKCLMTIKTITGGRVLCEVKKGMTIVLPRVHVQAVPEAG